MTGATSNEMVKSIELPLVATNEAFFPTRDDHDAHDAPGWRLPSNATSRTTMPPPDAGSFSEKLG